ncbi:iron-sulfur cluster carrier protein ApbC [uncultured Ferrimonas sp.]|uniref:iron-sulfur cluster carrier protein ApbC n=1 Tax=uncultured Ferrimonas sp. TaxID=432640 RepID=UPI0026103867|nr:iron-sulfur cluster carrier protein ApbC [uncultured Ferrimonas sp.]
MTDFVLHNTLPESLSQLVLDRLKSFNEPLLNQNLIDLDILRALAIDDRCLQVGLLMPYPCQSQYHDLVMALTNHLAELDGIDQVECEIGLNVAAVHGGSAAPHPKIRNVIAVGSGKGGVGKSTTAVNLALALAAEGARVGMLDADIYGPSIPTMLGCTDFSPSSNDGKTMQPAYVHNMAVMSMGFLVTDDNASAWRGPMAAGAMEQLMNETNWPELDYLVIDMPPGTGDIQLTLSQKFPVSGAVIVTTPQEIATLDARKGITMFNKVHVPVLGIVENMSYHLCQNCGSKEHPFGQGGGLETANRYNVPLLGELPLNVSVREHLDSGKPTVVAEPDGEISAEYRTIARNVAAALIHRSQPQGLSIEITNE